MCSVQCDSMVAVTYKVILGDGFHPVTFSNAGRPRHCHCRHCCVITAVGSAWCLGHSGRGGGCIFNKIFFFEHVHANLELPVGTVVANTCK